VRTGIRIALITLVAAQLAGLLVGQDSKIRYGRGVPSIVRSVNDRGLKYLAVMQTEKGDWLGHRAGNGSGVVGICLMAFLASGHGPDFGPYAENVRRAVRRIIIDQDPKTGHITGGGHGSMYHHGFATLALSEAYGSMNERLVWQGVDTPKEHRRTIGQALELAVRCALTAQKVNPWKAWRYSPESQDADTTVSGTVLMGLLGAKNAGIEIPNAALEGALSFFKINTRSSGVVAYQPASSHGDGVTRAAIATLVFAMSKRKDTLQYKAAAGFIKQMMDRSVTSHPFYYRYYMAQALFHSDFVAWQAWNRRTAEKLRKMQAADGSIESSHGRIYGTGMSILALALNYRLLPVYER
jgi:hypothetical protein